MNGAQKLMAAVFAVFALGFLMVGSNKQQTTQQQEDAGMIRAVAQMQRMANLKCPKAIKKFTGDQTYFPTSTPSDHQTYVSMVWDASKTDEKYSFKLAECTVHETVGGISKLVIDGETKIEKEVKR
ncbi:MAG: hypothetical protein HOE45_09015 [Gammaproteobacteria bacterium]|jgi:type II secretory pathway pseudopilin PulG|nr:hypothetical protein [Gammaproteobacteria bacterium]MBT4146994.1 hypothetical protein [Gammaproteobacteria bacterium]MBT5223321.1 hypothetical protein [Gammaproteobacteria bacterium]MBT5827033.1 hypothetical protein [Gammaproteobacteria bacterium]MBT5967160.1 hypothetical protein [Gammaproteobacteria bacterium]